MPTAAIGAILFGIALLLRWDGKAPRIRAWMFFGAGTTIGVGLLSTLVAKVVHVTNNATQVTGSRVFGAIGASSGIILVAFVVGFLFLKVVAKGAGGHKFADVLMFCLPAILAAAGGSWALLAVQGQHATTSLAGSMIDFVQQLTAGL
jgi:succinate dehydrogenase hydrophobic anchor subunit